MRKELRCMPLVGGMGLVQDLGPPEFKMKQIPGLQFYEAKDVTLTIDGQTIGVDDVNYRGRGFEKHRGSVRARRKAPICEVTLEMKVPMSEWRALEMAQAIDP